MKKFLSIFFIFGLLFGLSLGQETKPTSANSAQKRVFIVHGYAGDSKSHWFVWLKNELEKRGVNAQALDMPDSKNPKVSAWLATLGEKIGDIDENTFIVAHSLGCISTLLFIEGLDERKRLGGVVLVGGFYEPLSILPELNPFVQKPLQREKLIKMINKRIVLSAKDDKVVPTDLSKNLANAINAEFVQVPTGGHFMQEEVGKELPIVLELLEKEMGL